jgi:hypothetical protein
MDTHLRQTLRGVNRHLATLARCYRTRDRSVLDDLPSFVADRHMHTFALDSRAVIQQMDSVAADDASLNAATRELLAAMRSYLSDLEGVLVIEPPSFGLPPRQMDLRCIAFGPEVEAFAVRIRTLIAAG